LSQNAHKYSNDHLHRCKNNDPDNFDKGQNSFQDESGQLTPLGY